jgi:hypothetical protein
MTKKLNCKDVFRHICDNLDERLSSSRCREIKRHLDRCPNCTACLDGLKQTVYLYRNYPVPKLPQRTKKALRVKLRLR